MYVATPSLPSPYFNGTVIFHQFANRVVFSERFSLVSHQWIGVVTSGMSKSTMMTFWLSISLVDMNWKSLAFHLQNRAYPV
jgi:hypothetical protein